MGVDGVQRPDVPRDGAGEREMLRAYLDFHRETLALTCAGLPEQDLRRAAVPPSLDVTGVDRRSGQTYSLRRVLMHLLQEYARHNGHADLLRERIDGAAGV